MTFDEFVAINNNQKVGDGECVALVKAYIEQVIGATAVPIGNAHNYYDNFENTYLVNYFTKVAGTGGMIPGDIVVWNTNVGGGAGHIAICLSNEGSSFNSFDQNWPSGTTAHSQNHSLSNVSGYLRPNSSPGPGPQPLPNLELRTGPYGTYWTTQWNADGQALNEEQMQLNAKYIKAYLEANGWTINAIAGVLGNMEAESTLNPGRWENDVFGYHESKGYGLVQWTPCQKYVDWIFEQHINPSDMDSNLSRLIYEVDNNLEWIRTIRFPLSFKKFTKSKLQPSYLAKVFLLNYERPADTSIRVQKYRGQLADKWYKFLTGKNPPKEDKGYNFVLFNRRNLNERRNYDRKRRF